MPWPVWQRAEYENLGCIFLVLHTIGIGWAFFTQVGEAETLDLQPSFKQQSCLAFGDAVDNPTC